MSNLDLANDLCNKVTELGYSDCGIINVSDMAGYADKLEQRIKKVKMGKAQFGKFKNFATPNEEYPWAKSVIIATFDYSKYKVPEPLQNKYAKKYLFDGRIDKRSDEYIAHHAVLAYLESMNIKAASEPRFGITALRYAAATAGLGVLRNNNFLYSERGSYVALSAWLIDKELSLKKTYSSPACPENCNKCISACPTNALSAPYCTSLLDCVSFKNSMASKHRFFRVPSQRISALMGSNIFGCDICQDVCPMNRGKWIGEKDFPGLEELTPSMSSKAIMLMDYAEIEQKFAQKFWYIEKSHLWKWKINALTVLANSGDEEALEYIRIGLSDSSALVRRFAKKLLSSR